MKLRLRGQAIGGKPYSWALNLTSMCSSCDVITGKVYCNILVSFFLGKKECFTFNCAYSPYNALDVVLWMGWGTNFHFLLTFSISK